LTLSLARWPARAKPSDSMPALCGFFSALPPGSGEVVSIDELLNQGWPGVTVSPDSVYQAMAALRRLFGDDPKQPAYIATVPRLGYQMIAPVEQ
jgi:DNA-binding winged helix-turn-helix (wHTH) protein